MISTAAEDYHCLAGYVGWCDLADPSLPDHLLRMHSDPLLVGLRYDVSDIEGDFLLEPTVSAQAGRGGGALWMSVRWRLGLTAVSYRL